MSTVACPNGHQSTDPDWCDTCGAKIGGSPPSPQPPSPATTSPALTPVSRFTVSIETAWETSSTARLKRRIVRPSAVTCQVQTG